MITKSDSGSVHAREVDNLSSISSGSSFGRLVSIHGDSEGKDITSLYQFQTFGHIAFIYYIIV